MEKRWPCKLDARAPERLPVFRDCLKLGALGPELVAIPSGTFVMGSLEQDSDGTEIEKPHPVTILRPFALGRHPVTFFEYDAFCKATQRRMPEDYEWGRGFRPVIDVSWEDAMAYCKWLSQQTGQSYRLPTEAEWEYGCRAGTKTAYCFGHNPDHLDRFAWYVNNSKHRTQPVMKKQSNPWGLYDMQGNVWEWTHSAWAYLYDGSEQCCQIDGDEHRVVRGGCWLCPPNFLRVACRSFDDPSRRSNRHGFRVVRVRKISGG
ncbi:formylglycine-generating enzyme [Gammaproteobacteria bacterium]